MSAYPTGGDPTAVSGRRIGSYVVDWIIFLTIIPAVLFFATAEFTQYTDGPTCRRLEQLGEIDDSYWCFRTETTTTSDGETETNYDTWVGKENANALASLVWVGYLVVVMWLLQGLTGATVGKLLFGIRTVDEAGRSPGLVKQIIRGVCGAADSFPWCLMPFVPVAGLITMLVTKGHRRVADMAAKTYVVRTTAKGAPIVVPGMAAGTPTTPPPGPGTPPAPGAVGVAAMPAGPPPAPTTVMPTAPPPAPGTAAAAPPPPSTPGASGAPAAPPPPSGTGFAAPPPPSTVAPAPEPTPEPPAPEPPAPEAPVAEPAPAPPAPEPAAAIPPLPEAPPPGTPSEPIWVAERNAYIQWDEARGAWLTYDDAAGEWKPAD